MTNIIMAKNSQAKDTSVSYYLDTAAELSKLNRKNHKQVSDKGVPLMYDLSIEVTVPMFANSNAPNLTGVIFTAPDHWVTRNAVRMAHFTREELRKEAGVTKGSIGRYAKNLRMNLDPSMTSIAYDSTTSAGAETAKRIYAQNTTPWSDTAGNDVAGGTWDYSQLAQIDPTDDVAGDPFYLSVCNQHSAGAPGPYTRVGVNFAYLQRRQTVQADATQTSGGDAVNVNTESPFFRIPEQDQSEDVYQAIVYDEQDNPPYDRLISGSAADAADYAAILVDSFQIGAGGASTSGSAHVARVQAPLGLVQLKLDSADSDLFTDVHFQITCHGVYEMS
jgi:hypothetical protein